MIFPGVMYGCESWTIKMAECQRIGTFELWCWRRLLRAHWTARRSNQSILEEVNPEYLLEAEAPILWPLDAKNWRIGKDPDAGRDWGQEKGMTEDEMVGWHHQLNRHEFEKTPGVGDEHGSLACCSPWGHKESDTTEWLNNNNKCMCWSVLSRNPKRTLCRFPEFSLYAAFFSLVLMPVNLIYIFLFRLLALCQLRSLLDSIWIPCTMNTINYNFSKAVSWSNDCIHFICFLYFRDACFLLPDHQLSWNL